MSAAYFGCRGRPGHYWWTESGERRYGDPIGPWGELDGRLAPYNDRRQGAASLHHKDGWTALAAWDYTIDSRPGSNVAFLFTGTLTFDEAVEAARIGFSDDVERIGPLSLAIPKAAARGEVGP